MALLRDNVPDRAHSELPFGKLYGDDPVMHEVASASAIAAFCEREKRDFYCFGVDRKHPVVRFDLPAASLLDGRTGELERLAVTGQPGEYLPFQIAVWSPEQALQKLHLDGSSFPLPVRVFVQETNPVLHLSSGLIQVFWCMVELPEKAGVFHGEFHVTAEGFAPVTIPAEICSEGAFLADGGESDDTRLARLRWLDSRIGCSHDVPPEYVPLRREGRKLFLLGRTLTLSPAGLPEGAESFFSGCNDRVTEKAAALLEKPFRFEWGAHSAVEPFCRFTEEYPDRVAWEGGCRFAGSTAVLKVAGYLDYDGFASFDCRMEFPSGGAGEELALKFTARGEKFMGLDRHGGAAPERLRWRWDKSRNQDGFWLGELNGGLHLRLREKHSRTPLTNCYFPFSPLDIPAAWDNGGQGGIELKGEGLFRDVSAFAGPVHAAPGAEWDLGFELQITPFKLTVPARHWRQRFFQPYMHDLPHSFEETFVPEFFEQLRKEKVEIINIHHALRENPFLNLPFTDSSLPYLQKFVDRAHEEGFQVCLYYTIRELSVHTSEFWAFASLRGEILYPGPGNGARPVTAPMGAHPYLQRNCRFPYLSAWAEAIKEGPLEGVLDLAVETTPDGRLDNYYLEGLRYLLERCPLDGLYLDDTSLSREGFKRLRNVFRSIRGREPIINLHSWDSFNGQADYGHLSPAMRDMAIYPFMTSLWLGECYNYEAASPEYYLTEISGLPLGLMSEMLRNGGNPWRGMLFGMAGRYGWLADPRPLWKLFDLVDLPACRMTGFFDAEPEVSVSSPAVKATLFRNPDGRMLLAAASWSSRKEPVRFSFKTIRCRRFLAPEVPGYQERAVYPADGEIPVEPGRGIWLLVEE